MTPNLSDHMNPAVPRDPRDYDPGHLRIQNKEFKSIESHGSLSNSPNK